MQTAKLSFFLLSFNTCIFSGSLTFHDAPFRRHKLIQGFTGFGLSDDILQSINKSTLGSHTASLFQKTEFPYSKRKKHTFNPQLFVLLSNLLKGITVTVLLRLRWKDICTFNIKRKRLNCLWAYVTKSAYLQIYSLCYLGVLVGTISRLGAVISWSLGSHCTRPANKSL